jgi:prepilin-type N-terminal cleavage/methylation domain-containing protein
MYRLFNSKKSDAANGLADSAVHFRDPNAMIRRRAFSLLELLVVLAIIGLIATLSLPAIKNIRQSNTMVSSGRQLVDDLALARARAIAERTVVHVVFVPPGISNMVFAAGNTTEAQRDQRVGKRLKAGPFTTYALLAERSVGDQPGRGRARYLTEWKSLPQGVFIAPWKYIDMADAERYALALTNRPFRFAAGFAFPTTGGNSDERLPYISFHPKGGLSDENGAPLLDDEVIALARGSIIYDRNANTGEVEGFDVRESPPNNSVDNFHHVVVDSLTGRARVETPVIIP